MSACARACARLRVFVLVHNYARCVHVCLCACVPAYVYVRAQVRSYVHVRTSLSVCVPARTHTCARTHVATRAYLAEVCAGGAFCRFCHVSGTIGVCGDTPCRLAAPPAASDMNFRGRKLHNTRRSPCTEKGRPPFARGVTCRSHVAHRFTENKFASIFAIWLSLA